MTVTFSETVVLAKEECCNCGITFALPKSYQDRLRENHGWFYCPAGHSQHYTGESEAQKARRLLEAEQRAAASLRENMVAAQRSRDKAEKSLVRLKKRTAAGVCPCCSRTVHQLAEHMKSKHKEFLALNGLAPAKQLAEKVQ
jgi:hypothetical protein